MGNCYSEWTHTLPLDISLHVDVPSSFMDVLIYTTVCRGGSKICGKGGGAQRLPRALQARRFLEGPV